MDPTAMLWAKRQMERQERADMRRLIAEMREANAAKTVAGEARDATMQARMRQDGATGFVMVPQ